MTKNKWIIVAIIVVCAAIFLTIFGFTFESQTGQPLPWWAYIIALIIFGLIVYLVFVLSERSSKRFETMLINEGIPVEKPYKWNNHLLYVDFNSQRLANNYLSTRQIIDFKDVAGYRLETYRVGEEEELDENHVFVSIVITLNKADVEFEYQYLPVFETKVESADVTDVNEITPKLTEKYPELTDVLALQNDLKQILEINKANGIRSNVQNG